MNGIRWIIGLPMGYGVYQLLIWINTQFIVFVSYYLFSIPGWLWQTESLIINGLLGTYIAFGVVYFILPADRMALINNTKIRVIYWAISIATVIQTIMIGVWVYESIFHDGMIAQIFYTLAVIIAMWVTYNALAYLDYKYNEPARRYVESLQENPVTVQDEMNDLTN